MSELEKRIEAYEKVEDKLRELEMVWGNSSYITEGEYRRGSMANDEAPETTIEVLKSHVRDQLTRMYAEHMRDQRRR